MGVKLGGGLVNHFSVRLRRISGYRITTLKIILERHAETELRPGDHRCPYWPRSACASWEGARPWAGPGTGRRVDDAASDVLSCRKRFMRRIATREIGVYERS